MRSCCIRLSRSTCWPVVGTICQLLSLMRSNIKIAEACSCCMVLEIWENPVNYGCAAIKRHVPSADTFCAEKPCCTSRTLFTSAANSAVRLRFTTLYGKAAAATRISCIYHLQGCGLSDGSGGEVQWTASWRAMCICQIAHCHLRKVVGLCT